MKILAITMILTGTFFITVQDAAAQDAEMPVPGLVVKDADGKAIVQVITLGNDYVPKVIFNFDGVPAAFELVVENGQFSSGKMVYFSGDNCTGDVYISEPSTSNSLDVLNQTSFVITGPDATSGAYRVFRSTSPTTQPFFPESRWNDGNNLGSCQDQPGSQVNLAPAEEILPTPLGGFHGPTTLNPERILTIDGGTRLP